MVPAGLHDVSIAFLVLGAASAVVIAAWTPSPEKTAGVAVPTGGNSGSPGTRKPQ